MPTSYRKHAALIFLLLLLADCKIFSQINNQHTSIFQRIGPGGGGATFLPTFSYHSPNNFFIRCDMTGSYLTNDGGESYLQFNFDNGAASYAFDPHNAQIIYAGSAVLNRSIDGSKTWQQVFPKASEISSAKYRGDHAEYEIETASTSLYEAEYSQIKNIKVDPSESNTVYFSMGNYFFYTADGCNTFQRLQLYETIDCIYTSKAFKDEVYICTASAIYIFNKHSHTIQQRKLPEKMSPAFSFCGGTKRNSNKLIMYALHYTNDAPILNQYNHSEVWTSNDNGNTWHRLTDSLLLGNHQSLPNFSRIVCAEFDAASVYLISDLYEEENNNGSKKYWYGVIKTSDAGKNWQWVFKAGSGSAQYGVQDGIDAKNLQDAWASKAFGKEFIEMEDAGVYPYDGNIAVLTDWYRTMKTTDGGKTWKEIYSRQQTDRTYISRGLDVTNSYNVHFDPFDSNHIAVSYTDIGFWHSYNKGKSWIRSMQGVPKAWENTCYSVVFDPVVKNKLWSAWSGMHDIPRGKMTRNPAWKTNYKGGICVSEDGGKTWKPLNAGPGDDALVTSLALDKTSSRNNRTLYAAVFNKGVFKSTDDGKTWQQKNNGIDNNTCAFQITIAADGALYVVISPTPNHAAKNNDSLFYPGAVYKSTDGADSWQKLLIPNVIFPNNITIDPHNANRIYISCWADIDLSDLFSKTDLAAKSGNKTLHTPGGIFLSEDAGKTFTQIFDSLQYVYAVTVDTAHKGRLWCCTFNKAAYCSDDYGKTWQQIKDYDFHWGHTIIPDPYNAEKIYITTYGSGVWYGIPVVK